MKKSVFTFVVSSLIGLTGGMALAQEQSPSDPSQPGATHQYGRAHHPVDPNVQAQRLAKRLNLTADQQTQVVGILTAQKDQVAQLRADASLSQQDRRAKMQGLRADGVAKIRSVLTDDQKQKFDEMQQKRAEKQQNRKG